TRPDPHEIAPAQRSTSNTANRLLVPPTAHVSPSGANETQVTYRPSAKSSERTGSPVSRPKRVSTFWRFVATKIGAVGWTPNVAPTERLLVSTGAPLHCARATSQNRTCSPQCTASVRPSGAYRTVQTNLSPDEETVNRVVSARAATS